MMTMMMMTIKF